MAMLSREERAEIDAEIAILPDRRSACIEALRTVQRHRRWIDDEALADVAAYLGLSAAELEGVASFYNLLFRKPVGRHVILVCDSVSCWILGADAVKQALIARLGASLGEVTPDDRFTALPIQCLGACDRGPALMIDEDLHGPVAAEELEHLLSRYA
jgi:NADH-quinone oxidoreductase subunit E